MKLGYGHGNMAATINCTAKCELRGVISFLQAKEGTLHLKKWLGGRCFNTNDELQDTVKTWLNRQEVAFFAEGIGKLVHRYDKCLNLHGDYVEK